MKILVLCTDAFGGHGGIAKFNRDLLAALCACPEVEEVVALPRLQPEPPGPLPDKLRYDTSGVGGKLRYLLAACRTARRSPSPPRTGRGLGEVSNSGSEPSTGFDLILCGHINLLPAAFLARSVMRRKAGSGRPAGPGEVSHSKQPSTLHPPPSTKIVLIIHGIDAWQPTRGALVNRLVRKIDAFIAVSEFTRKRFLAWAFPASGPRVTRPSGYILPNCVDLARFTPGPKNPDLLERYGLRNRTVLLTVARLSADERYKGIDEVLEVLPELAKQIPNLSYLIVGDGTDRARLMQKARSLGLRVSSFSATDGRGWPAGSGEGSGEVSKQQLSTLNSCCLPRPHTREREIGPLPVGGCVCDAGPRGRLWNCVSGSAGVRRAGRGQQSRCEPGNCGPDR